MPSNYLYADPHFSHIGVTRFTRADGSPLRPWDDVEEMNEALVEKYNAVVKPNDKVYFMGDCTMNKNKIHILSRLNGDKILIKGNHDNATLDSYREYFRDIRACHEMNAGLLTHIPVHDSQLERYAFNIHGHLHANQVMLPKSIDKSGNIVYSDEIDPRYLCVSVEQIDYTPILLEEAFARIEAQGGRVGNSKRV